MENIIEFTKDEEDKITESVRLYLFVKELLIYNEIIDPDSNTFPQVINELRNAYDHINRVLALKLELVDDEKADDYSLDNLKKVVGHVYRACYDCLDWLSVNVTEEVKKELEPFSRETIREVIPDYYKKIRPSLPEYERRITELRKEKDVANVKEDHLVEYAQIVRDLSEIRQKIRDGMDTLIEYESKRKRENLVSFISKILIGVVAGALLVLYKCGII